MLSHCPRSLHLRSMATESEDAQGTVAIFPPSVAGQTTSWLRFCGHVIASQAPCT